MSIMRHPDRYYFRARLSAFVCVCVCVCVCVFMYVCMHACMYVCASPHRAKLGCVYKCCVFYRSGVDPTCAGTLCAKAASISYPTLECTLSTQYHIII
jgi:hypothetical protein